jgi:hypothetical protein
VSAVLLSQAVKDYLAVRTARQSGATAKTRARSSGVSPQPSPRAATSRWPA